MNLINWGLYCVIYFLMTTGVYAGREIRFNLSSNTVSAGSELILIASLSGFLDDENIYLKAAFSEEGNSDNYFGLTKNLDGDWIKNSIPNAGQPKFTVGQWDGNLYVKPDYADTGYKGPKEYDFKLRFYVQNGQDFDGYWSENTEKVYIIAPTCTLTPTCSNTPVPTIKPEPTNTKAATPTPTLIPTPIVSVSIMDNVSAISDTVYKVVDLIPSENIESEVMGTDSGLFSYSFDETTFSADIQQIASDSAGNDQPVIFSLLLAGLGTGILSLVNTVKVTRSHSG